MGRPKGLPKTGGRRPGSRNKLKVARQAAIDVSGLTPLEFMLSVMCDPAADRAQRLRAATYAAPFMHAKLMAVEHTGANGGAIAAEATVALPTAQAVAQLVQQALAEAGIQPSGKSTAEAVRAIFMTGRPMPPSLYVALLTAKNGAVAEEEHPDGTLTTH
jgi:hypothetical protein